MLMLVASPSFVAVLASTEDASCPDDDKQVLLQSRQTVMKVNDTQAIDLNAFDTDKNGRLCTMELAHMISALTLNTSDHYHVDTNSSDHYLPAALQQAFREEIEEYISADRGSQLDCVPIKELEEKLKNSTPSRVEAIKELEEKLKNPTPSLVEAPTQNSNNMPARRRPSVTTSSVLSECGLTGNSDYHVCCYIWYPYCAIQIVSTMCGYTCRYESATCNNAGRGIASNSASSSL